MIGSTKEALKGAKLVDFTGTAKGFKQLNKFGPDFTDMVRSAKDCKAVVVVDRAVGSRHAEPMIVRDHINLSGNNPLLGPNHPGGDRFPVVQGVYLNDFVGLSTGIAAGLHESAQPDRNDIESVRNLGADCCCYNMVPAMLVAAHAGWKVLGLVLPEGVELTAEQLKEIAAMTGSV